MLRIGRRATLAGLAAALASPTILRAQSGLTSGAITIVAPFPPGGSSDAKARIVAEGIAPLLGRQVVVENQAGAGGRIAARQVASAPKDGSKILLANTSVMVLTPLQPEAGYDPIADFAPVAGGSEFAVGLATGPLTGAKSLAELVSWLKANPTQASFGIPASGSLPHLTGIAFGKAIGLDLTAVPYRGGAPIAQDLLAGKLAIGIAAAADFAGLHQAGQLRLVGVTGAARAPGLPDAATFAEAGFKGFDANAWNAFFVPAGTPQSVVAELNRAINAVLSQAETRQRLEKMALVSTPSAAEAPMDWIKRDRATYEPLLKAAGLIK
jgi:tripartite-type tricarboxylate transporter receptor subunit TctC